MNTSLAEEHVNVDLESSPLASGGKRWMAENGTFGVEIIPNESVAFIADAIHREIFDILNLYVRDTDTLLALLQRAATFADDNPNTLFQESVENGLLFKFRKLKVADAQTLQFGLYQE
jgi:hypothetical protein